MDKITEIENRFKDSNGIISTYKMADRIFELERKVNMPEFSKCKHCNGSGRMPLLRDKAEVLKDKAFQRGLNGLMAT